MKKLNLFLFSALLLGVISCGSDDEAPSDLTLVDPNPAEDVVIDANTVASGISVDGATRNTGNAPAPNSTDLTFDSNAAEQSAFLSNGFDIRINVPDTYAGAYLQVAGSNEYLTIPSSTIFAAKTAGKNKKTGIFKNTQAKMNDNEVQIDVDFAASVPAGTFCYLLCIYDENGNISQPVEVCVEVEAWGGNSNLVGTWNYSKSIEDGVTIGIGEADCDDQNELTCDNNNTISVPDAYCYTLNSVPITFNADGTYEYEAKSTYRSMDFDTTLATCTATFLPEEEETYISRGNWAYDEEEKKLTLVEFSYVEMQNGETFEGVEENGYLLFDGDITLSGSELVIKETYTDGGQTFTDEYFFTR